MRINMWILGKVNAVRFSYVGLPIICVYLVWVVYNYHYNENGRILLWEINHQNGKQNRIKPRWETPASDASIARTLNVSRMVYISNGSHLCDKSKTLLLTAIIISSPENTKMRRDLRDSWTKPLLNSTLTTVLFFMGRTKNETVDKNVVFENEIHHDLVVVDFDESYRNLSLKTILMLRWIRDFCPNTRFVLKCDDDMFINVYTLTTFILENKPNVNSIYGRLAHRWIPIRDADSKWMVTEKEYNDTFYPDFVSGPSYLIGIETVNDLIESCVRLPYLFLEDVFVTGICARRVNVTRVSNRDFLNESLSGGKCRFYSVISVHRVYGVRLKTLHEKASDFDGYKMCSKKVSKIL